MGPEVTTVREGEGLFEALRYMCDKGVRRMLMVDHEVGNFYTVAFDQHTFF